MTELHENYFWHRRMAHSAIMTACVIGLFYILTLFAENRLNDMLHVGTLPALLAGATLGAAMLSLTWSARKPRLFLPHITQLSMLITVGALIATTSGMQSYFLPLWLPAVIFIGVLGGGFLLLAALVAPLYAIWLAFSGTLDQPTILAALLIGEVPLLLSSFLFSHLATRKEDNSYKQLAHQLNQVSDKAEVVITAITNGVVALDKQGTIELINPAAQRLIGWESHDALKLDYKSVLKLIDNESKELTPANDPIRRALSTNEEVRTDDYTLMTNSGKKLLVSLVASPVGGPGSGIIIVFRDITKEKAEEREQAEFISTASHEMRTPVASIEGYLGLALNPATAQVDEKARNYITKAHEAAQHLGRLFQDLLDTARAEDGRLSNNPRAVEVVSFVYDIVEGLRPHAEAKGLVLVYKPMPDGEVDDKSNRRLNPVFYANVDNDHLREVVGNLIENAIKYTKQGTISIDISGDDKQVEISIADTGIGIPAEDLSHLFQKFYRVDNSDTREIGGTGLGLYLSRRLVEAMEGRIWAESQHGQGSTFSVSIPRISHQEAMQLIETLDSAAASEIGPIVAPVPIEEPQYVAPALAQPEVPATPAPQGGVFASPPAEAIAAQLVAAPVASATPQPQPTPPVYHQPPAPSGPSLATIEQDPTGYLHRSRAIPVPQRSHNPPENQNQP